MTRAFDQDDFDADLAAAHAAAMGADCADCEAAAVPPVHTPLSIHNPPDQSSLQMRIGRHPEFLATMIDQLSSPKLNADDDPETLTLRQLISREPDDYSMGVLDAGAQVFDLVTFYQERFGNENYFKTATERTSVESMAELLDYHPNPGVAATTLLAFTVENGKRPTIPVGVGAQSIPNLPGELSQTFETIEEIQATSGLNLLSPRMTRPPLPIITPFDSGERLTLNGTGLRLEKRAALLYGSDVTGLARVGAAIEDMPNHQTTLRLRPWRDAAPNITTVASRIALIRVIQDAVNLLEPLTTATATPALKTGSSVVDDLKGLISFLDPDEDVNITEATRKVVAALDACETLSSTNSASTPHDDELTLGGLLQPLESALRTVLAINNQPQYSPKADFEAKIKKMSDDLHDLRLPGQAAFNELFDVDFRRLRMDPLLQLLATDTGTSASLERARAFKNSASWLTNLITDAVSDGSPATSTSFPPPLKKWLDASTQTLGQMSLQLALADSDVKQLYEATQRYLDTRGAGIPADTQIAIQIRKALIDFENQITSQTRGEIVNTAMQLLSTLQSKSDVTSSGEYPRVRQWLDAMIEDLADAIANLVKTLASLERQTSDKAGPNVGSLVDTLAEMFEDNPDDSSANEGAVVSRSLTDLGPIGDSSLAYFPDSIPNFLSQVNDKTRSAMVAALEETVVDPSNQPNNIKVFRITASVFGVTASATPTLTEKRRNPRDAENDNAPELILNQSPPETNWLADLLLTTDPKLVRTLPLDREYPAILAGSTVVIDRVISDTGISVRETLVRRVVAVNRVTLNAYRVVSNVTQLTLDDSWLSDKDSLESLRNLTVYAQSESLPLASEPYDADIASASIELEGVDLDIQPERRLVIRGERTDIASGSAVIVAEAAVVLAAATVYDTSRPGDHVHTVVNLVKPLTYQYKRSTVKIYGNVAQATHGKTVFNEALSASVLSDPGSPGPSEYMLRQSPLTFVQDLTPAGASPALQLRVSGVQWHQVSNLVDNPPDARVYVVRVGSDGKTTLQFGDGREGAIPSPIIGDITATYRIGQGVAGNVLADSITMLAGPKPLGVQAVTNPLPATGGANRDSIETTRYRAPLAIRGRGRLVGLSDYEAFALNSSGIGKATAVWMNTGNSSGRRRIVITVAGVNDAPLGTQSVLSLQKRCVQYGDIAVDVLVLERALISVALQVRVRVDADYNWADVKAQLDPRLRMNFGPVARQLAEPLWLSEIVTDAMQVPGVLAVAVDKFGVAAQPGGTKFSEISGTLNSLIPRDQPYVVSARPARLDPKSLSRLEPAVLPAEIAAFNPQILGTLILNPWLTKDIP